MEARRSGATDWSLARADDVFCAGDQLRTLAYSRAAVLQPDETEFRLDQNTTITFLPPRDQKRSWVDLLRGAILIISREPTALGVLTPFANAGIEGTEFLVVVTNEETTITVFEGAVAVSNAAGEVSVSSGQQASARSGQAPLAQTVLRPRDSVQWTLYYAPVLSRALPEADESPSSQQSSDPLFYTARAARRLGVGRVDEARADLAQAASLDPDNVEALSLQSIVALTQSDKDEALRLADRAVAQNPGSAAALLARSYAQQAFFDISGALATLQDAVRRDPQNALAWARLSELWLAVGDLAEGLSAAQMAAALNPSVERTQTVLGFAYLTRVEIQQAMDAFEQAIALDQGAPLPRLGLGLALIRSGELTVGRQQIEIAVILDPGNALIRSYMGKAYYEEKRDDLAQSQLEVAKQLDPLDPTAWFYDAIRKQTTNQPVEALRDVQQSIELNDNRAVYRSRLLLDEDLAARSSSLGRVYRDLGFEKLALVEAWKSLDSDPSDYSGHRLLADTYVALPRHEIARVNELRQSQLLQPLNLTPVQPQLAESNLFILDNAGPADVGFNEFNPLFNRNRVTFQGSAVGGGNETRGEDVTVAGISDRWSYSAGQFHFETDGFRPNNDLEQDVLNGLVQFRPSEKTSLLAELRSTEREQGDLGLLFHPDNFVPILRDLEDTESLRLGIHQTFSPRSELIASVVYQDVKASTNVGSSFGLDREMNGQTVELEHLYRATRFRLTSGARYTKRDEDEVLHLSISLPFPPFLIEDTQITELDTDNTSAYVYANVDVSRRVGLTIGASADSVKGRRFERDEINPKIGVSWESRSGTLVRAAAFRTLQPASFSRQDILPRLEPTHVVGVNQFFAGSEGEQARRYALDLDHPFSETLYSGLRLSRRVLDIPFRQGLDPPAVGFVDVEVRAEEDGAGAYVYWTPTSRIALRAEYQDEDVRNDPIFTPDGFISLETRRLPLEIGYFHPGGISAGLTGTYVEQSGEFDDPNPPFLPVTADEDFWVLDASLGYRLPNRRGLVSLKILNLLDEEFRYQDTDPENPRIVPGRLALLKFTVAFP